MRNRTFVSTSIRFALTTFALAISIAFAGAAASAQSSQSPANPYLNEGYTRLRQLDYERAIESFKRAVVADPANVRAHLDLAYTLLTTGKDLEAIASFKRAIELDPNNTQVRSQLGYLYIQQGATREAIEQFLEVERLDPDNFQVKTQLGYLYDRLGDKGRAREKFMQAERSEDPEIVSKARQALSNLSPVQTGKPGAIVGEVYAAPFYQSRFGNFIAPLIVRNGVVLETDHHVEAYTSLRFTRDTRSVGGSAPQIYSDNFLVAGVGLRARPFKNDLTVYAEAGVAMNTLRSSVSTVRARSDFRAGVYYTREWGTHIDSAGPSMPMRLIGDLYFDASYYSRFRNNIIGYGQLREGLRFFQWNKTSFDLYGRLGAVKDTGRDFYNNIGEGGAGLRFTPYRPFGLTVSAEYVRGLYFGIERAGEPNPYGSRYNDFRLMFTFGKYYTKE